jgi:hypothetical protein
MEAGALRGRLQATLTGDANIRRQAEIDLRQVRAFYSSPHPKSATD